MSRNNIRKGGLEDSFERAVQQQTRLHRSLQEEEDQEGITRLQLEGQLTMI
jgi:hypothetical protein